jgi:hypothetical protein
MEFSRHNESSALSGKGGFWDCFSKQAENGLKIHLEHVGRVFLILYKVLMQDLSEHRVWKWKLRYRLE